MTQERKILASLLFLACCKIAYFFTFVFFRNPDVFPGFIVEFWALKGNDTSTYYESLNGFFLSGNYDGACRMPGLGLVYLPIRFFLSHEYTLISIVFVQLIAEIISSYLCCLISLKLFQSMKAFYTCVLLIGLSAFVTVRANYLLSDSLCSTSLVLCLWYLLRWRNNNNIKSLLLSAFFLAWSIFLRQICIVVIPVFISIVVFSQLHNLRSALKYCVIFLAPLVIGVSVWTIRNKIVLQRNIVLVAPVEECMGQLSPEFNSIRQMLLKMGQDIQPWAKGSAAHWFFTDRIEAESHISARHLQGTINADSLAALRIDYRLFVSENKQDTLLSASIIERSERFSTIYVKEHPWSHYAWNRVNFLSMFLFPTRLDDLPLPKMSEAPLPLIALKAFNYIILLLVNGLFVFAIFWIVIKRHWYGLLCAFIGLTPILILGYLGYVEQRYLVTSFYFMIICISSFFMKTPEKTIASI